MPPYTVGDSYQKQIGEAKMERRGGGGDAGENVETPEALFTAGESVKLENVEWH